MSKKVLVTSRSFGTISDEPLESLKKAGFEVTLLGRDFDQAVFEKEVAQYDALIIGAHDFPESVMERCGRLKIICKHGTGLDNIPLKKAEELGITVCNAAGTNSNAVADFTFALMLAVARNVVLSDRRVHEGKWKTATGVDVFRKTLGLLGFGAIATNVARRAGGFGMKVFAYDNCKKKVPEEMKDYVTMCDMEKVLSDSDFLCVHLPLTRETYGFVGAPEMARMKKGSYLINTARGGIVDEKALYEALVSGHIAGAAMDVSESEPISPQNPLLTLDNVIITPHMGMYSKEAMGAVSMICAQNVVNFSCGKELTNRVV